MINLAYRNVIRRPLLAFKLIWYLLCSLMPFLDVLLAGVVEVLLATGLCGSASVRWSVCTCECVWVFYRTSLNQYLLVCPFACYLQKHENRRHHLHTLVGYTWSSSSSSSPSSPSSIGCCRCCCGCLNHNNMLNNLRLFTYRQNFFYTLRKEWNGSDAYLGLGGNWWRKIGSKMK